jgi:putative phosphoribosyl transferase
VHFVDRRDAGRQLAGRLVPLVSGQPIVVGLPRGGVPVAYEVARALGAPLDVLVVRKLGCPWQPELGVGALGEGGIRLLNRRLMREVGVTETDLGEVIEREQQELDARVVRYRGDRDPIPVEGRTVIVVDDGLATGFTARAAIEVLRRRGAGRVVLAVPVARWARPWNCGAWPTRSCACTPRRSSGRSGSSTTTSPRPPTVRWPGCWPATRSRGRDTWTAR